MTIQKMIDLLKREGIGSKQLTINKLENLDYKELKNLERDVKYRLAKKAAKKEFNND